MALIVEDGTGLADAEAYVSVATVDAYADAMGFPEWIAVTTAATKESAIRRATQYLDTRYTFRGEVRADAQALKWPRAKWARVDSSGLETTWPVRNLQQACCELAIRALTGPLTADIDPSAVQSEAVGPISTSYFQQGNGGQVRFAAVDALLADLTAGGRSAVRIERV